MKVFGTKALRRKFVSGRTGVTRGLTKLRSEDLRVNVPHQIQLECFFMLYSTMGLSTCTIVAAIYWPDDC
jgi:hypothetical protein